SAVLRNRHSHAPCGGTRLTGSHIARSVRSVQRIDTDRLAAAQPAADVCPIVNLRRSQRRGAGCREGPLDRPLHRPAALGRPARPLAQIRVAIPFHWRFGHSSFRTIFLIHSFTAASYALSALLCSISTSYRKTYRRLWAFAGACAA